MTEQELLKQAVKMNPELWHAVQIVTKASQVATFPIANLDALLALFTDGGGESIQLEDVAFTKTQVKAYLPPVFFPIEDAENMLGKMYAALLHGKRMHALEADLRAHKVTSHQKAVTP